VGHAGEAPSRVRAGFLATALGVVASFLVLAAAAAGLKAAGYAAGWGIQFQQPWFLAIMAAILALFAANLFGLFEIRLPGFVTDAAAGALGPGRPHTLGQHFLTGAFATLLATPCSAPFLGTAVGFALASGPAIIFLVFAALGIGLALPYLAVAGFPAIAAHLPRPGAWMLTLRRVLGIVLLATAAWLVSLLLTIAGGQSTPVKSAIAWRPFDLAAIAQLVDGGNVVFVDVTADWCITCQVNKSLVLERGEVREALSRPGVIAMRADWTRPDPVIADYLASFGRYGIPFDVVYGPSRPHGEPLPEILSTRAVSSALERAAR
jgi:suppressor for copper-sensitivity B